MRRAELVRCAACLAIGIAFSTAHPAGIVLSIAAPALALLQPTRPSAYAAAVSYYGGALWSIVPGAGNFFGAHVSLFGALCLWFVATLLLAIPWFLVWTKNGRKVLWRAPAGLMLSVAPPLGLIGWASPLTSAGFLFPGTSWFGLVGCAFATGALALRPKVAIAVVTSLAISLNLFISTGDAPSPRGWQGVNTNLGASSDERSSALAEFETAEFIQHQALASNARVIIFPEAVISSWTAATDAFWDDTLTRLQSAGKTIIVGVKVIEAQPRSAFSADEFALSVAILKSPDAIRRPVLPAPAEEPPAYRNVLVIRGHHNGMFDQRIPVPISMWMPFGRTGVQLHLTGPGILQLEGQRAAVLICYEQLLTWPILTSLLEHPTIIMAVANDYWAHGTTIPRFQLNAVRAWARLMSLPYVSATNL